jgi:hypothetical protein
MPEKVSRANRPKKVHEVEVRIGDGPLQGMG